MTTPVWSLPKNFTITPPNPTNPTTPPNNNLRGDISLAIPIHIELISYVENGVDITHLKKPQWDGEYQAKLAEFHQKHLPKIFEPTFKVTKKEWEEASKAYEEEFGLKIEPDPFCGQPVGNVLKKAKEDE